MRYDAAYREDPGILKTGGNMSKKTFVVLLVVIVLLGLAGVGIIVIPPLLQDAQLNKEAEEYAELMKNVRVQSTETVTESVTEEITPEPADTNTPEETAVVTDTLPPEETQVPETEAPPEDTETPETGDAPSDWNPFDKSKKQDDSVLDLFSSKEEKKREGNGLNFGGYSDNPDNISPVDNPDRYNEWVIDKYKTPTPSPVPTPTPTPSPSPSPSPTPTPAPRIGYYTQINLTECKNQNSDFIAWLKIPGTTIDYPVVHTNNTDYYLTHTFDGTKSDLGTLFSLGKANWKRPSRNIVIYGHHVEGSGYKMFKALLKYKDASYYKDHSTVYLDSMYADGSYQIFAVFNETEGDIDPSCSSFASNAEFLDFVYAAKDLSLYDTGVVLNEEDHIITFVTCDRYFKRGVGRLVVMAVKR